jgi:hypothetical protein
MMSGNNPCKRSMILSSIMGFGSWWNLHSEPTQLDIIGYSRKGKNQMAHWTSTKQGLWKKYFIERRYSL